MRLFRAGWLSILLPCNATHFCLAQPSPEAVPSTLPALAHSAPSPRRASPSPFRGEQGAFGGYRGFAPFRPPALFSCLPRGFGSLSAVLVCLVRALSATHRPRAFATLPRSGLRFCAQGNPLLPRTSRARSRALIPASDHAEACPLTATHRPRLCSAPIRGVFGCACFAIAQQALLPLHLQSPLCKWAFVRCCYHSATLFNKTNKMTKIDHKKSRSSGYRYFKNISWLHFGYKSIFVPLPMTCKRSMLHS